MNKYSIDQLRKEHNAMLDSIEIDMAADELLRRFNLPTRTAKRKSKRIAAQDQELYFIRCGDTVKIGRATYPEMRLTELQTGAPGRLYLLAHFPNMGHKEKECHKRLAHLRVHGEWFWHTEEIDALIKELENG